MCVGQTHIPPLFDSGNFTNMIRTGKKNCVRTGCLIVYIHMNKFTTFTTSSVLFCFVFCFVIDIYIYICIYRGTRNDWCPLLGLGRSCGHADSIDSLDGHVDTYTRLGCDTCSIDGPIPGWPACSSTRLSTTNVKLAVRCFEYTRSFIWNETVKTYERL